LSHRQTRRRRQRVVRLEIDHRPHGHAHRRQRFLQRMELRPQRGLDALAGLVARPQQVAKGLDHVVGGHAQMRRIVFDQLQHAVEDAATAPKRAVLALGEAAQAIEVAEQLVGAVDEVDDHARLSPTRVQ
jgi:hypothetical protein